MPDFYLGLDLGQAQDYTALAIVERMPVPSGHVSSYDGEPLIEAHYHVRYLQRFKLGTLYPAIVTEVGDILRTQPLQKNARLVVDATGVGRPVVDLLGAARFCPVPVTITAGDAVISEGGNYRVPKRDLVSTVQVLLQSKRLKWAEGLPEVPILIKEMLAFQAKITAAAHDVYGSWREGTHDDLVLAVALAVWYGEQYGPQLQPRRPIVLPNPFAYLR